MAAESTLVAGVLLLTAVQGWSTTGVDGLREAIAVPVLVGLGVVLRHRLRDASYAVTGIGVVTWVLLAANGVSRGIEAETRAAFWTGFDGWPLLVAAGYAALVASVRTLAPEVRAIAAGSTLLGLSLLVLLPGEWTHPRGAAPRRGGSRARGRDPVHTVPWSTAASVLGGTVAAGAGAATVLIPAGLALDFVDRHEAWSTGPDAFFPTVDDPSAWTLAALVLASLALVAAVVRRDVEQRRMLPAVGPVVLALAAAVGVAGAGQPLWVVVAALGAVTVVGVVAALVQPGHSQVVCLMLGAEALALSLAVASRSDLVLAVLASVLAVLAVAATALRREVAPAVVLLVALAVDAWAHVADADILTRSDLQTAVACSSCSLRRTSSLSGSPGPSPSRPPGWWPWSPSR